ncbi:MAG: zinc-ribbon domain-containing protein [Gemmatimonadota bacterium]
MIGVFLFGGVLLALIGVVVYSLARNREPGTEAAHARDSAADRMAAALEALREIEFEHRTGKLADEDYRQLRRRYGEQALRARAAREVEDPATEAVDTTAREAVDDVAGPQVAFCAECGRPLEIEDRFCSRCGAARDGAAAGAKPEGTGPET